MKPCILLLTCANDKEADKIVQSLLRKKLAVCIKKTPIGSSFLWQGKIDSSKEVLLIMDSIESKFKHVEKEIRKIHSYDTFVLVSLPITKMSAGIEEWIKSSLR